MKLVMVIKTSSTQNPFTDLMLYIHYRYIITMQGVWTTNITTANNIPLATGNKLNCFICAREMLSIIVHCALVLLLLF